MNLDDSTLRKSHRQLSVSERSNMLVNMSCEPLRGFLNVKLFKYNGLYAGLELGGCMLLYS